MKNVADKIEGLLFVSGKPMSYKQLVSILKISVDELKSSIDILKSKYSDGSGILLADNGSSLQFVTNHNIKDVIEDFIKDELTGDMTRPQLETLTIIAYRGPISKEELEMIRGVNCTLILRNLMMRGLVELVKGKDVDSYQVTIDFLRYLGISSVSELPDYEELSKNETVEDVIKEQKDKQAEE